MIQRSLLLMIQRSFCGYRSTKQDCLQIRYGIALTIFDRAPKRWRRCDLKGCKQWTTKWLNYTISIKWIRYTTVLLEKVCRTYIHVQHETWTYLGSGNTQWQNASLPWQQHDQVLRRHEFCWVLAVCRQAKKPLPSITRGFSHTIVGTIPTDTHLCNLFNHFPAQQLSTIVQHSL